MKFKSVYCLPSPKLEFRKKSTKVSLLLASILFSLFFLIFQLSDKTAFSHTPTSRPSSLLAFLKSNENNFHNSLTQEILLTDTEPLFLPTPFSYTSISSQKLSLKPDINYFSVHPQIHYLNTKYLHSLFNPFSPTIHTPTEAFELTLSNFAESFGPKSEQPSALEYPHSLYLQVSPLDHPSNPIILTINPNLTLKKDNLINPCEFYILIHNHSIVGNIKMLTTSGHEDFDNQLKTFILTYPEITHLHDGYYKIIVGN